MIEIIFNVLCLFVYYSVIMQLNAIIKSCKDDAMGLHKWSAQDRMWRHRQILVTLSLCHHLLFIAWVVFLYQLYKVLF